MSEDEFDAMSEYEQSEFVESSLWHRDFTGCVECEIYDVVESEEANV